MAPTFDPLTPADLALINGQPFYEGTPPELQAAGLHERLNFLMAAGYFKAEQTHFSADMTKIKFRFTRTDKPAPAAA